MMWPTIFLGGAAFLLLLPVSVFFGEILAALTARRYATPTESDRPRLALVMPAHNESSIITATLRSIAPQLTEFDRLLVIADNCVDDTAALARSAGAEVIERSHLQKLGKGYALDYGIRHLEQDPPEIVIIMDADCRAAPGSIDNLARLCATTARPIQALYLMHASQDAGLKMRIAEFAWIVKNQARPEGLHRLGLPCQLMGTGMAFPWQRISTAKLASGEIVEDLKLGLELTSDGAAPLFCAQALVTSDFPNSSDGAAGQRTRWEHGHLRLLFTEVPRLLVRSIFRRNIRLLALTLDLSVPPLALLTLLVAAIWCASAALLAFKKATLPISLASADAILLVLAVFLSWHRYGRQTITLGKLALAVVYAFWKIPLYARFLVARQIGWVRSKRNDE